MSIHTHTHTIRAEDCYFCPKSKCHYDDHQYNSLVNHGSESDFHEKTGRLFLSSMDGVKTRGVAAPKPDNDDK